MSITISDAGDIHVQYILNQNMSLSPMEQRIVKLEKEGKTLKQIASDMNLSSRAIQMHMHNIRIKLHGKNKE